MMNIYWQSDVNKNVIVRETESTFEQYYLGEGWKENRERFDIIAGVDPYYSVITEEEAMKIIEEIKRGDEDVNENDG